MRKNRKRKKAIDRIDMTPLIDLTFILLIVFMLTAPVLENGMKVDPPTMSSSEIKTNPDNRTIMIDATGAISYQGNNFDLNSLIGTISDDLSRNSRLNFYVRGDKDLKYGKVIEVIESLHQSGVQNAFLVTRVSD